MRKRNGLILIPFLFLMGCNDSKEASKTTASAPAVASAPSSAVSVDIVRNALMKHNFGEAEQLSDQLTAANPDDLSAWVVAAEAKAANQNRLASLTALEQAFNRGFREVAMIEQSTYLSNIRRSDEYRNLLKRFDLQKTASTQAPVVRAAEDVSIVEQDGITEVRAGDVSVKLPN